MDPVCELPYWPAAKALHIEAGQMAASDYVPTYPNLLLASEGVSTDAVRHCNWECPPMLKTITAKASLAPRYHFRRVGS